MKEEGDSLCSLSSVASAHPTVSIIKPTTRNKSSIRLQKSKRMGGSSSSGDVLANLMSLSNSASNGSNTASRRTDGMFFSGPNNVSKTSRVDNSHFRKGKRLFSPEKKITSILETVSQPFDALQSSSTDHNQLPKPVHAALRTSFKRVDQKKTPMKYYSKSNTRKVQQVHPVLHKEEKIQRHSPSPQIKFKDSHDNPESTTCPSPIPVEMSDSAHSFVDTQDDRLNANNAVVDDHDKTAEMVSSDILHMDMFKCTNSSHNHTEYPTLLGRNDLPRSPYAIEYPILQDELVDLNMSMAKISLDNPSVSINKESFPISSSSKLLTAKTPTSSLQDECNQNPSTKKLQSKTSSIRVGSKSLRRSTRHRQPVHRLGSYGQYHDSNSKQPLKQRQTLVYLDESESDDTVISHTSYDVPSYELKLNPIIKVDSITVNSPQYPEKIALDQGLKVSENLDTGSLSLEDRQTQNRPEVRRSSRDRKPVSRFSVTFRRRRRAAKDNTDPMKDKESLITHDYEDIDALIVDGNCQNPKDDLSSDDNVLLMDAEQAIHGNLHEKLESTELSTNLRRSQRTRQPTQRLIVTFTRPQSRMSTISHNDIYSDSDTTQEQDRIAPIADVDAVDSHTDQIQLHDLKLTESAGLSNDVHRNELGWSEVEIQILKRSYRSVDPLSQHFWRDVATKVPGKTAEDCRSMWFSMIKTPSNKRLQSAKKTASRKTTSLNIDDSGGGDDDIFDSTPLRVLFHVNSDRKKSSKSDSDRRSSGRVRFSLEFKSPIVKSDDEMNYDDNSTRHGPCAFHCNDELYADDDPYEFYNSSPIISRANSKGYIQKLKAGWKDDAGVLQATQKSKKSRKKKMVSLDMNDAMTRDVMDSVDVGDVHMNGVLSPGGTLHIQAPDDLELEELFLPSDEDGLSHC